MAKAKVKNPTTDHFDGEFHEFSEEQTSSRIIEVGDQTFNVVQENPHNLWRIVPSKGTLPKALDGRYTSVMLATHAITAYVNKKEGVVLA